MSAQQKLRCAVYTRKSSEEGLDQEFNSLDAQREACSAFVASQVGLGWKLVPDHYDDGGISGGTMDRPGLRRLLSDIRDQKVDVVVVYKIDRLTRSLMDFAKIVEVFDANGVSFVSVTQQFNTTTSMGRLTLNVLLSFAQFEREVTAERIRDKIAASKRKGIWMGGRVSVGYKVVDRKLMIDEPRAEFVRGLFRRYLDLKSVASLAREINLSKSGARTTSERSDARPEPSRRNCMSRGQLYHLLSNPIYVGKLRHKGATYEGEHNAIISTDLFEAVQLLLRTQAPRRGRATNAADIHVLTGLVFDETGDRLSPGHANKKGKRYRYYVSSRLRTGAERNEGWRIPAPELERIVEQEAIQIFSDEVAMSGWITQVASAEWVRLGLSAMAKLLSDLSDPTFEARGRVLRLLFDRIILSPTNMRFFVDHRAIVLHLIGQSPKARDEGDQDFTLLDRPLSLKRRGVEARLVISSSSATDRPPDRSLIRLIARAHLYLSRLAGPEPITIRELAKSIGSHPAEISRVLPLAFLSPLITNAILVGRQPVDLTARKLSRLIDLPASWREQVSIAGF